MSWGEPKSLADFEPGSPFFGLEVPGDVAVTSQVVAQPDPTLAGRVIAQLTDGTPLVTRKTMGDGQVVLFHVTANAEWSTLPLSGLFVQMLERLAISTRPANPSAEDLEGTIWIPDALLDAHGTLSHVDTLPGLPGARIAEARPGPDMPPGLYVSDKQRIAINTVGPEDVLAPASWPGSVAIEGLEAQAETDLKGWLLGAALPALPLLGLLALGATLLCTGRRALRR